MEIKKEKTEIEMSFEEFEGVVCETVDGVALIDEEGIETLYRKKNLNDLFCLANENTIKRISYINKNGQDLDVIEEIYITLTNNKKFIVEQL